MSSPATTALDGSWIVACHDDEVVLSFLIRTLRLAGYRVVQAYDGLSCYKLALEMPALQLMVVNSRLGQMDGPALIERVRSDVPHVGVLHVGSDPDGRLPPDVPNLAEPFTAAQLLEAVGPLLEGPRLSE
jgi:DNA-binding NtrC family response regulator